MKFSDLRPGELFEFAGRRYRKSGPLTASPLDGEGSRMMPRSANVSLVSEHDRGEPPAAAPGSVPAEEAAQAVEALYRLAKKALDRLEDDSAAAELEAIRALWLKRLGLDR